jgi:xanthosine utilization system XapX-like protein
MGVIACLWPVVLLDRPAGPCSRIFLLYLCGMFVGTRYIGLPQQTLYAQTANVRRVDDSSKAMIVHRL